MITFKEFLEEAFQLKKIPFGTNIEMDNHEFNTANKFIHTFFEYKDHFYVVILDQLANKIAFKSTDKRSNQVKDYSYDQTDARAALQIFNSVMYIITLILKKFHPPGFYFSGAIQSKAKDPQALKRVYSKMITQKSFIEELKKTGYTYIETENDNHIFKKIGFIGKVKLLIKNKVKEIL